MHSDRTIELFLELIQINSLSGEEKQVADYIYKFLENLNCSVHLDNSSKLTKSNTGNVICKIGGGGSTLLTSHMDTARPTKDVKPIFRNGSIESDRKTALGVDNRAGNAVLLSLIEYIVKNKIETKPFTVSFTTCEETTIAGSKYLEIDNTINEAFVFDSHLDPGKFVSSSSGAVTFTAEFIGRAAHSGINPDDGINSIIMASSAILGIKQGKVSNGTTINIGKINGGNAVNVIPDQVTINGEIRSTSKEDILKKLASVEEIFNETADQFNGKCSFNYVWDFEPFHIGENNPVYKKLNDSMNKVGLSFQPEKSMGGSDANSFNARGISAVNLGIGAKNPHSNEEFIKIDDFLKTFNLALELVK